MLPAGEPEALPAGGCASSGRRQQCERGRRRLRVAPRSVQRRRHCQLAAKIPDAEPLRAAALLFPLRPRVPSPAGATPVRDSAARGRVQPSGVDASSRAAEQRAGQRERDEPARRRCRRPPRTARSQGHAVRQRARRFRSAERRQDRERKRLVHDLVQLQPGWVRPHPATANPRPAWEGRSSTRRAHTRTAPRRRARRRSRPTRASTPSTPATSTTASARRRGHASGLVVRAQRSISAGAGSRIDGSRPGHVASRPAERSLSAYAGQTVRIQFKASTDSSLVSSFYIDDVSIG